MILLAGGDSFTWGNELPDCDESRFSRLSWAALLAEQSGMDYVCVAKGGASNTTIVRKMMQYLDKNDTVDRVEIMWTFPVRHALMIRNDHRRNMNLDYVDISPAYLNDSNKMISEFTKIFLTLASHEYHEQQSLFAMYSMTSYLKERKIPFRYSAATVQVYEMLAKDNFLKIDAEWYRHGEGFYDWARKERYAMSELKHPASQAHRDWIDV
jgi:hypothetical protein